MCKCIEYEGFLERNSGKIVLIFEVIVDKKM
jgi:hypothetical protein